MAPVDSCMPASTAGPRSRPRNAAGRTPRLRSLLRIAALTAMAMGAHASLVGAAALTVNSTTDVLDGDVTSIAALLATPGPDGVISLREAIRACNNTPNGGTRDEIRFNIAGPGPHTIQPTTALPALSDSVGVDGTTEPDFAGTPVVRIDGSLAGPNVDGLSLASGSSGSIVRGFMITRFSRDGILVQSGAANITIAGNWIGTAGTGTTGTGNSDDGIDLRGSAALIGGTVPGDRNVVTQSGDEGIDIVGTGATGHVIRGNIIGLDPDGSTGGGNADVGIAIISGTGNTIGGSTAAARNVISRNTEGIEINTANNVVQGNYIGTDATGALNQGNRSDDGIEIQGSGTGNRVGGTGVGEGNLIAFNALNGVTIVAGSDNAVLANSIHSNGDLGINLGTAGPDPNDSGDADSGPNGLQNYPVLTSATSSGGSTTITGTFNSNASTNYRIEFFSSPVGDASGYGEGQTYLGLANVTSDGSGNATINTTLTGVSVTAGHVVSAAATVDLGGGSYGSTSELAANVTATASTALSGTVFEDANFTGTAADYDGGASDLGLANVDVELYNAGTNGYIASATTAAGGTFVFNGVADGSYKVRARSATIGDANTPPKGGLNAAVPATWPYPLAEMTWGNGAARYGGQSATVDDAATGDNAGPGDTYVTVVVSGGSVTGVNLGFTYNLIVNAADDSNADNVRSRQGSLRQFLKNTNAIGAAGGTTANSSQFRMQVAANQSSGADSWWRIAPAMALPSIADGGTTINGTTQTTNGGDSNSRGPEIELNGAGTGAGANGLQLSASGGTVRGLVINAFSSSGIQVNGANALIAGNWLGLDATGVLDRGNGVDGVTISANSATIGGAAAVDRNVISGNDDEGIDVDPAITGAVVKGNRIGTNATGTAAVGNGGGGSSQGGILAEGTGTQIGGALPNEGNLISGNLNDGIYLTGTTNVIEGNRIGTDAGGTLAVANSGPGIVIVGTFGGTGNRIGGGAAGQGNTIAFNMGDGIRPAAGSGTGNAISGNSTFSNSGLGIDLNDDGVTANDGAKTAGEPNLLMDFPVFTSAELAAGSLTVAGYVGSAPGQATFANARVEVFQADGDASGYGEGRSYLGFLTADAGGNFGGSLAAPGLVAGNTITGTATDGSNNTSEFGSQRAVGTLAIVKRAFRLDGTPIPTGTVVPTAVPFRFLLYISNPGPAVADVSLKDVLDPAFAYVPGSIRYAGTAPACALPTCTPAEEGAVFAAANSGTVGTDAPDGDVVSVAGATIDAGDGDAANLRLDVPAGRVWAMVFTFRAR